MTDATSHRYFTSIAGFLDQTAFIRVERIGSEWDGTTVRRDGSERPAALRGITWIACFVRSGVWREIDQREADNLLSTYQLTSIPKLLEIKH